MEPSGRFTIETQPDKALLVCKAAEKGDTGRFSVILHNDKGQDSAAVNVVVFGRDLF